MLYNTPEMTEAAFAIAEKAVGKEKIITAHPCMGSEDFSVLGEYVPYYFYWIGSGREDGLSAPWHSEAFSVGDKFLKTAASVFVSSALYEIKN